ncbi:MAG: acetyl-CoA carboxylase biotin carboxylase subunit [Bacteroidota bacterium]
MKAIKKILIANRGEIAIRVMRTCREMGIATVAVYSDADKDALFVKQADEAISIGGLQASDSYLNQEKIINAAKITGADAIHPGYGFLSENAGFVKKCTEAGFIFIGPSAEVVEVMGSKSRSKEIMQKAGIPTVPGYNGKDQSIDIFITESEKIGFPILIKAAAGGGGKGMRIVYDKKEIAASIEAAKREAQSSFGEDTLLIEKYFESAKHIEFQLFGDHHGNYTHFFERECSIQRRFQKIIEESPSPSLTPELREKMGKTAIAVASSIKYTNAGTVEFILDAENNFYFLEVNTRLQVEHPVTEETTGIDLVRIQIEVAKGMPLKANFQNTHQQGHAIECRIYAEDPATNFFPATGNILIWNEPHLNGIRYDSGVASGSKVDIYYDPMIAKIIAKGNNREEAIQKMQNALEKFVILGLTTNKNFLLEILQHPSFGDGTFDTHFINKHFKNYTDTKKTDSSIINEVAIVAMLSEWNERSGQTDNSGRVNGWRNNFYQNNWSTFDIGGNEIKVEYRYKNNNSFDITINDKNFKVESVSIGNNSLECIINNHRKSFVVAKSKEELFIHHPTAGSFKASIIPRFSDVLSSEKPGGYKAPMPGEIVKLLVKLGEEVVSGKGLVVISSMKMETTIEAHSDGIVEEIFITEKSFVEANTILLKISSQEN